MKSFFFCPDAWIAAFFVVYSAVALSDRFRGGRKRGHEHQKGEGAGGRYASG
jgi:hypothetical protein